MFALPSLRQWCLLGFASALLWVSGLGCPSSAALAAPAIAALSAPLQRTTTPTLLLGTAHSSPLAAAAEVAAPPTAGSSAAETPAQLFALHCAGCHANGGNIIRRGKNLKARAMARHGVDSPAAVAAIITAGKGLMSAYGDRFTPEQVEALATYVWERSQDNWR
jgi:cytochrome c6